MDRKDKLPYSVDPNKALNLRKGIFLLVKMVQLKFKETVKFEFLRLFMIWFWASETNTIDYQKFCSKMINRFRSKGIFSMYMFNIPAEHLYESDNSI